MNKFERDLISYASLSLYFLQESAKWKLRITPIYLLHLMLKLPFFFFLLRNNFTWKLQSTRLVSIRTEALGEVRCIYWGLVLLAKKIRGSCKNSWCKTRQCIICEDKYLLKLEKLGRRGGDLPAPPPTQCLETCERIAAALTRADWEPEGDERREAVKGQQGTRHHFSL